MRARAIRLGGQVVASRSDVAQYVEISACGQVTIDWVRLLAACGFDSDQSMYVLNTYFGESRPRWRQAKVERMARMVQWRLRVLRREPAAFDSRAVLTVLRGSRRTGSVLLRSSSGAQWWELMVG
jgi:hypothetical protein